MVFGLGRIAVFRFFYKEKLFKDEKTAYQFSLQAEDGSQNPAGFICKLKKCLIYLLLHQTVTKSKFQVQNLVVSVSLLSKCRCKFDATK